MRSVHRQLHHVVDGSKGVTIYGRAAELDATWQRVYSSRGRSFATM